MKIDESELFDVTFVDYFNELKLGKCVGRW